MKTCVSVLSIGSISALGSHQEKIKRQYYSSGHGLSLWPEEQTWAGRLPLAEQKLIEDLKESQPTYEEVDSSVLYGIFASRLAADRAGWKKGENIGINLGSSRGATTIFERDHQDFLKSGKTALLTSPSTTLGNISSWVAQDLKSTGCDISHSVTCSTSLHAVLNGIAWLESGMASKFLAGGSEAALTSFTAAQMRAMRITAASRSMDYPCRTLDMDKKRNTMVLGEGACVVAMVTGSPPDALCQISGVGFATEALKHPVAISANGTAFAKAMKMALEGHAVEDVDAIVMHAPGTVKGDLSEFKAIKSLFGDRHPALTSNKWKLGHSFGASGALSLEMAVHMLQTEEFFPVPFGDFMEAPKRLKKILVNAVGFGGNAVSLLLTRGK